MQWAHDQIGLKVATQLPVFIFQEDELLSLEDLGITDLDLIQDDSTQPVPSFATDTDSKTSVLSKYILSKQHIKGGKLFYIISGRLMRLIKTQLLQLHD